MTGLEEPAADAEGAASELRSALALADIDALSIGWSAVGGARKRLRLRGTGAPGP